MKNITLTAASFALWISLLLKFSFPQLNMQLAEALSKTVDPASNCTRAVIAMGESLSKDGLHKTIACALRPDSRGDAIPVLDTHIE